MNRRSFFGSLLGAAMCAAARIYPVPAVAKLVGAERPEPDWAATGGSGEFRWAYVYDESGNVLYSWTKEELEWAMRRWPRRDFHFTLS